MKKIFTLLLFFAIPIFAQFSGNYNVGTGETYTTLKSFFDAVNASSVTGNINVYITSDITEAANIGLGVNTAGYSITIRPSADADRTITFTQLADNSSPTGHLVIGYIGTGLTSSWADSNTVATNNVTIDGYADGGSTRRLIFTNTSASHTGARVIVVVGACQNTIIKNCIINNLTTNTTSPFCVGAVVRKKVDTTQVAPSNLTIENNILTATGNNVAMGSRITNSGTITWAKLSGFVFKNNSVTAKRRLLEINYTNGGEIYGNQFTTAASTAAPATISYGLWTATGVTGTFNIYNNKFLQATCVETAAFGHRVISLASTATCNVYNNMFSGMDKTSASSLATNLTYLFYGATGVIYNNTFYMPALTDPTSTGYYSCIQLSSSNPTIKNNIFISDEATHNNPYFVSAITSSETDYNDYYVRVVNSNHKYVSTSYTSFTSYQTANPTKDINSKNANVTFASATDLHLSGGSIGDYVNLIGTPLSSPYNLDIDGSTRHATYPYKGADERPESPLPVELTIFTAVSKGNNVELNWKTATETNNAGFEIERRIENKWVAIGYVEGAGTSNTTKEYQYSDVVKENGSVGYRLKQIDRTGLFTYSNVVEVTISQVVESFTLGQNYPNPFNPTTTINFSVPSTQQATLKIYDITGREIVTLFNAVAQSGQVYNVQFNAHGLASGIYLYVLQTPTNSMVKKMSFIK